MDFIKHIVQELEGNISEMDAKALEVWKNESVTNEKLYKNYIVIWNKTGSLKLDFSNEKIEAKEFLNNQIRQTSQIKIQYWKWAIAASLLLFVGAFGWNYLNADFARTEVIAKVFTTEATSETFILPDHSEIILGPNSSFSYQPSFNQSDRVIKLTGSLFVDVTKNKHLPFVVRVEGFDVRVLGTAFQISAVNKDNMARVSVLRGMVEVATKNMKIELHPDQAATINITTSVIEESNYSVNDLAQFTEPIIFDNTPLSEVAKVLEERFHVMIKLEKSMGSLNCTFTGKFSRQDLDGILLIIKKATHMKLKKLSHSSYIWTVIPC